MLNYDILIYIISFIDCDSKVYLVNKFFNENFKCRAIKYKNLSTCFVHLNRDIYNVILELKRNKSFSSFIKKEIYPLLEIERNKFLFKEKKKIYIF